MFEQTLLEREENEVFRHCNVMSLHDRRKAGVLKALSWEDLFNMGQWDQFPASVAVGGKKKSEKHKHEGLKTRKVKGKLYSVLWFLVKLCKQHGARRWGGIATD